MSGIPFSIAPIGTTADEVVASAGQLESLGYGAVWLNENRFDAYVNAAAVAATTKSIRIGTAVAVWSRSPVQATLAAASIDQISHGRFLHGIGSGPANRNEQWHGIPYQRAALRLREYLQCLRLAWQSSAAQPANFKGTFYTVRDYVRSHRPVNADQKIVVGVARPLAARIAAEYGDGVLLDTNLSVPYIRDVILPAVEDGARRAGRNLDQYFISAGMLVSVDSDRRQAIEWAKQRLVSHVEHEYYRQLYEFGGFGEEAAAAIDALHRGDTTAAFNAITDEMVLAHACAGTPDDVRKQITHWLPFVNDLRITLPLGSLTGPEVATNWHHVLQAFPAGYAFNGG